MARYTGTRQDYEEYINSMKGTGRTALSYPVFLIEQLRKGADFWKGDSGIGVMIQGPDQTAGGLGEPQTTYRPPTGLGKDEIIKQVTVLEDKKKKGKISEADFKKKSNALMQQYFNQPTTPAPKPRGVIPGAYDVNAKKDAYLRQRSAITGETFEHGTNLSPRRGVPPAYQHTPVTMDEVKEKISQQAWLPAGISNYPRLPQSNVPATETPTYPTPGRPKKYKNPFAWRRPNSIWSGM